MYAETIVAYDIRSKGDNADTTVAASESADGIVDAQALTASSGLSAIENKDFMFKGWEDAAQGGDSVEYLSFGFTVESGTNVTLTNLTYTGYSSAGGPGTIGLYWSEDNFTTALAFYTSPAASDVRVDLNLSALDVIVGSGQTIEFRLIEIGDTKADGNGQTRGAGTYRVRADSVLVLNGKRGSVPELALNSKKRGSIPEPSSYALLGGCLALACAMVRRRR